MNKLALPLDQILPGDCVSVLSTLPENSVDLIFADPPYNLQLQQELYRPNMTKVDAVDDEWDHFDSIAQYDQFTRDWLAACRRVLKDTGTIWVIGSYHNIYRVGSILQDLGYWILNDISWIKLNPMPNFRGVRFTNAHETLLWAQGKKGAKYTFNHHAMKALNDDLQMRSDWYLPICSGEERIKINRQKAHPTQKPEALLYRVILASSNPGDIVLDPFFGTGTTGAVAKKLHRRWIGIEKDKNYVRLAKKRIDNVAQELFTDDIFSFEGRRSLPRIPFGTLLERGLLRPGEKLYFGRNGKMAATILADGHIKYNGFTGSIHQVGRAIQNAPCNGWEHWFYLDKNTDEMIAINKLRERLREKDGKTVVEPTNVKPKITLMARIQNAFSRVVHKMREQTREALSHTERQFMPELTRFFGIIIRMYAEPEAPHHVPHFHAYYQDEVAIYGIDPVQMISGSLPKRQQRLVEAWVELHQVELLEDWNRLQAGQRPTPILPLR